MKVCETMNDFVQMHMDLELPMPKRTFQETIPMPHRFPRSFPTVHEIFSQHHEEGKGYVLTHEQAMSIQKDLKDAWATAVDIDYKGFGVGGTFKDQLCRFSQTDKGLQLGLDAARNFRLTGAIHFKRPHQAERFLNDWIAIREQEEE